MGEPAWLAEVRAELAATDAALVSHLAWELGHGLVVTRHRRADRRLGPAAAVRRDLDPVAADLDMAASELAGPFAAAIRGSLDERLPVVGEQLVGPVLAPRRRPPPRAHPVRLLAGTPSTPAGRASRDDRSRSRRRRPAGWRSGGGPPSPLPAASVWSPARTGAGRGGGHPGGAGLAAGEGAARGPSRSGGGSARWPPRSTCCA